MKHNTIARILNLLTCLLMLTAVAINKNGRVMGRVLNEEISADAKVVETVSFTANADTITLSSVGVADDIVGYADVTPVEIKIVNGKIIDVTALPNDETPGFFESLYDAELFSAWNGLTPKKAMEKQVDAVSGATYSSTSVINTVNKTLSTYDGSAVAASAAYRDMLSVKFIITLLVILSAVILPFVIKSKIARTLQLIVNVAVLGFWSHTFLSLSLMVNYISNGFPLSAMSIIAAILLIVAFIFPLFGKTNHYCNWICPLGSAQELAGKIVKRKPTLPVKLLKGLDIFRQILWVGILLVMMLSAGFEILDYEAFSAFMLGQANWIVLAIAIVSLLLSVFVQRPYCRFICPTGSTMKYSQSNK